VPSPSCPVSLRPQAHRVPSVLTATVSPKPAATEIQFVLVVPTWFGATRVRSEPSPSWPTSLAPHPYSHGAGVVGVAALESAEEKLVPAALEACTRNWYVVPLVKPVTVCVVAVESKVVVFTGVPLT